MRYELYPISVTNPNWLHLDNSLHHINLDAHLSNTSQKKDLKTFASLTAEKHIHLGLALIGDLDLLIFLGSTTLGPNITLSKSKGAFFMLATTALPDWKAAIYAACRPEVEFEIRLIFNKVHIMLQSLNLISTKGAKRQADGTFIINQD